MRQPSTSLAVALVDHLAVFARLCHSWNRFVYFLFFDGSATKKRKGQRCGLWLLLHWLARFVCNLVGPGLCDAIIGTAAQGNQRSPHHPDLSRPPLYPS